MTDRSTWKDAVQIAQDEVSLPLFRRLALTLDLPLAGIDHGAPIPLAWTAILFPALARQSEIGADGHAQHGDFIPVMPLPKRMFAGRTVEQFRPVCIGDRLRRRSTITDLVEKTGRSGPLIFLTIMHEISGDEGLCYTERQEVVFRDDRPGKAGPAPAEAMPQAHWTARFVPDPVLLFRYSALTFNGHRIHFDAPYARDVEGYRGLVVNGGLTTLKLLEFARETRGAAPVRYTVRAMQPLFAGEEIILSGAPAEDGAIFWASDASGATAMKIRIGSFG